MIFEVFSNLCDSSVATFCISILITFKGCHPCGSFHWVQCCHGNLIKGQILFQVCLDESKAGRRKQAALVVGGHIDQFFWGETVSWQAEDLLICIAEEGVIFSCSISFLHTLLWVCSSDTYAVLLYIQCWSSWSSLKGQTNYVVLQCYWGTASTHAAYSDGKTSEDMQEFCSNKEMPCRISTTVFLNLKG